MWVCWKNGDLLSRTPRGAMSPLSSPTVPRPVHSGPDHNDPSVNRLRVLTSVDRTGGGLREVGGDPNQGTGSEKR